MSFHKTKILGTGIHLPKKVVTNFDLEKTLDTTDKWIRERTGISERRISSTDGGEFTTDLAVHASQMALKNANLEANDIDMILLANCFPDMPLPNSACLIQRKLGMTRNCACLDIAAACTGLVYAFNIANSMIQTSMMEKILVIASEVLSPAVDWQDRSSCILFGDGCGAMVLGRAADESTSEVYGSVLDADGDGKDFFKIEYGGVVNPITSEVLENRLQFMRMQGKEMFRVAVRTLSENALKVIEKSELNKDDVDWVVPHQANIRIIEAAVKRLGISMDQVIVNIEKYGNTSAATIPIAFHEAVIDGRIKRGEVILFDSFGAGLTSGATLFRY